jgi:hypothetical protein
VSRPRKQPATCWLWGNANENERWLLDKLRERELLNEVYEEATMAFEGWVKRDKWPKARLAGGGQGPRQDRIPLPVEVAQLVGQAEELCQAYPLLDHCNEPVPGQATDVPLCCDLVYGHSEKVRHYNRKLGYYWWGEK